MKKIILIGMLILICSFAFAGLEISKNLTEREKQERTPEERLKYLKINNNEYCKEEGYKSSRKFTTYDGEFIYGSCSDQRNREIKYYCLPDIYEYCWLGDRD